MKLASLALAVACAASPIGARAQAAPAPPQHARESTLVVSGDATVEREPDLARISATIDTNDDDATRSAGKNSAIFETLKTKLAAQGISGAAIVTTSFNTNFVPKPTRPIDAGEFPQRYGFVTSRSLAIAVSPIDSAGKIVDAALAAGVTQVGNVAFELKDRKGAYREALGRAFADARANAAALVAGSGLQLVAVRQIGATDYGVIGPRPYGPVAMRTMSTPQPPTQIDPGGPIDVTAHVTVTYEIRGN